MRKFAILLPFVIVAIAASAQAPKTILSSVGQLSDTLTNAETAYFYSPVFARKNQSVMFSLQQTQLTGTSAGKCRLQESIDGTTWRNCVNFSVPPVAGDTVSFGTMVAAGLTMYWKLSATPAYKYRIMIVQSGSSTTKYVAKYFIKPE
jgi:hypothetical protein